MSNSKFKSLEKIGECYYIIKFEVPEDYTWIPGQFAKFSLEGKELGEDKNFRMFSIASTPEEGEIMIATKALAGKTSNFKKALFELKESESIDISKPMGKFTLRDKETPMVLYASGIGVTPIRSVLHSLTSDCTQAVHVVYASYDNYIFEDEIKALSKAMPNVEFVETVEVDETMNKLREYGKKYLDVAYYYTSGSPFVVDAVRKAYTELGISADRFIDDVFIGY
ncbi:MAG: FAD-dependent oxidoreductase [Christensenellaceae bacterium]|nr:FAD-dependent oxidoreductase [Christensenellaceae bacterium]